MSIYAAEHDHATVVRGKCPFMLTSESEYLFALSHLPSFSAKRLRRWIDIFGSAERVWNASIMELMESGIPQRIADRFCHERASIESAQKKEQCARLGIAFHAFGTEQFPPLLAEISDPPLGLFVKGKLNGAPVSLAVVGTRRPSLYGQRVTRELVGSLAEQNIPIISGLALGIDGIAHEAALERHGTTIAILAAGLDQIYPSMHTKLAERIVESGGALVSEFPPHVPALKHHFPIRNRLIAGMTNGTLVTEAPRSSGALLTAELALGYDRDVFAVPGPITNPASAGTNHLIKRGAQVVTSADDVLAAYHMEPKTRHLPLPETLTGTERNLLAFFGSEPLTVDQLVKMSTLEASVVNATLTLLLMKGWIVQLDPVHYTKV